MTVNKEGLEAAHARLEELSGMRNIPSILTRSGREFIAEKAIAAYLAALPDEAAFCPECGWNSAMDGAPTALPDHIAGAGNMVPPDGLVERLDQAVARCEEVFAHSTHEGLNTDFALMAKYRLSEAATVIQTLQRERDELRAALRPFAERAVGYEHLPAFETDARFQHLRRARLLLKEGGE